MFQHTAARRRLQPPHLSNLRNLNSFNTQPPEGGCPRNLKKFRGERGVSTHSRPKAAAPPPILFPLEIRCFNTQPPEGGCGHFHLNPRHIQRFQHTAARRRLPLRLLLLPTRHSFNTQPPEGGCREASKEIATTVLVSTHSRPKAAADRYVRSQCAKHCFNTQPPEGGCITIFSFLLSNTCFNTQPPEGGCWRLITAIAVKPVFQHTAARRRLHFLI